MTRDTSIDSYNAIRYNGLLSKRRFEVYEALYKYGPATTNELFLKIKGNSGNNPCVHARLNELRASGVVREIGEKICSVTGMTVIEWDVTSNLPVKANKERTNKQKLEDAIKFISSKDLFDEFEEFLGELYPEGF